MGDEEEIIVEIRTDGTVNAEGLNFRGKTCDNGMKFLTALGEVKKRRKKAEYYQAETETKNRLKTGY